MTRAQWPKAMRRLMVEAAERFIGMLRAAQRVQHSGEQFITISFHAY